MKRSSDFSSRILPTRGFQVFGFFSCVCTAVMKETSFFYCRTLESVLLSTYLSLVRMRANIYALVENGCQPGDFHCSKEEPNKWFI